MDFEPSLSSHFLVYIRDYLLDKGLKLDRLAGFEDLLVDIDDEKLVPLTTVAALYEEMAANTGNKNLGMDIGLRYHYESAGMIVLLMLAAPSVEKGIKALAHYDQRYDTAIEIDLDIGPKLTRFSVSLINPTGVKVAQIHEYLIVFLVQALSNATRKPMPVREVWFQHARGKDPKALQDYFDCPIKFGQTCNRVAFDSSYLKEKFYSSNKRLFELCSQMMKGYTLQDGRESLFLDVVCREILRQLKEGSPSLESVAGKMAISGRTLSRRLADRGLSFQEVKNLAREKKAKYFLEHTSMSMSEIAFELGYSELSAFSRAFRSWTGAAPQSFRESE